MVLALPRGHANLDNSANFTMPDTLCVSLKSVRSPLLWIRTLETLILDDVEYRWDCLDRPGFMAVPEPLLAEFCNLYRLNL